MLKILSDLILQPSVVPLVLLHSLVLAQCITKIKDHHLAKSYLEKHH